MQIHDADEVLVVPTGDGVALVFKKTDDATQISVEIKDAAMRRLVTDLLLALRCLPSGSLVSIT